MRVWERRIRLRRGREKDPDKGEPLGGTERNGARVVAGGFVGTGYNLQIAQVRIAGVPRFQSDSCNFISSRPEPSARGHWE